MVDSVRQGGVVKEEGINAAGGRMEDVHVRDIGTVNRENPAYSILKLTRKYLDTPTSGNPSCLLYPHFYQANLVLHSHIHC